MIILDDKALNILRKNIDKNLECYRDYHEPWIQNYAEIEVSAEHRFNSDTTLILSNDPIFDTENAIRIYENNKMLSTTLSSSNHYWTTLAHTTYYKYMKVRWPIDVNTNISTVEMRYFFSATNQKSRSRHGLTRLWWIGHLTYDDTNSRDPYYYTKLATKDQELFSLIMETKHVAQNKKALFAMLDTLTTIFQLLDEEKIKKFNKRNFFRDMMKQINLIGSVTVWDMLSQEEAMQKLMDFAKRYLDIESYVFS